MVNIIRYKKMKKEINTLRTMDLLYYGLKTDLYSRNQSM